MVISSCISATGWRALAPGFVGLVVFAARPSIALTGTVTAPYEGVIRLAFRTRARTASRLVPEHFWGSRRPVNILLILGFLPRNRALVLHSTQMRKPAGQIEQDFIGAGPTDQGEAGGTACHGSSRDVDLRKARNAGDTRQSHSPHPE